MVTTAITTLTTIHCCNCGLPFGVPAQFERARRNDHHDFYCPAGHRQHFPQKSREERLEQQLDATRAERDTARKNARHFERSAQAYRGHLTRTRRRIANGVCPCCSRTFRQLSRHMQRMHPQYVAEHGTHDATEEAAA